MSAKPENISWGEYAKKLEREIKSRVDSSEFLISSQTINGNTTQFRPIAELREEYNLARQMAASESLGATSPFFSDCAP